MGRRVASKVTRLRRMVRRVRRDGQTGCVVMVRVPLPGVLLSTFIARITINLHCLPCLFSYIHNIYEHDKIRLYQYHITALPVA